MKFVRLHPVLTVLLLAAAISLGQGLIAVLSARSKDRAAEEYVGTAFRHATTLDKLPKSVSSQLTEAGNQNELGAKRGVKLGMGQRFLWWYDSDVAVLMLVEETSGPAKIVKWWVQRF